MADGMEFDHRAAYHPIPFGHHDMEVDDRPAFHGPPRRMDEEIELEQRFQAVPIVDDGDNDSQNRTSDAWLANIEKNGLRLDAPAPEFKLGAITVMCLIFNRMIGTGIFTTPSVLMQYTQNSFVTLLFWLCGCITAIAGSHLFIEYGMYTPRYGIRGAKKAVPKSGGELVYLKYLVKKPPFFAVCLFGISFILIGTAAANAISFAIRALQAADYAAEDHNWAVRGIAILAVLGACFLHSVWRMGGLYLNNIFAIVKIAMLLLVIVIGFLSWGNVIPHPQGLDATLKPIDGFGSVPDEPYAFARAYLSVIFAFGGFNQANYVLGEVKDPRRNFRWPSIAAVAIVCSLYIGVNLAYMVVVPAELQIKNDSDVALLFFQFTFGQLHSSTASAAGAQKALRGLMAVSSLGNVIVMTYTAARVKQEIAKEGILPFRKFLIRDISIPGIQLSRLIGAKKRIFRENIPFGALVLNFIMSAVAILVTALQSNPYNSYAVLSLLYSYTVDAFFGICLAIGMLYLRFPWSGKRWSRKSGAVGFLSISSALIYGTANLFPVAILWWPQSKAFSEAHQPGYPWYIVPTVGVSILTLGGLWWAGYFFIVPKLKHKGQRVKILRLIDVDEVNGVNGYYVGTHDTVDKEWRINPNEGDEYEYEEVRVR